MVSSVTKGTYPDCVAYVIEFIVDRRVRTALDGGIPSSNIHCSHCGAACHTCTDNAALLEAASVHESLMSVTNDFSIESIGMFTKHMQDIVCL